MVHFLSPISRRWGGRLPPLPTIKLAVRGPFLVHWFIHSFVSSFVCSFVHWYVHSFVCSFFHLDHHHRHNQIPFLVAYIETRQAEIDLIVSLSAKFQMKFPIHWNYGPTALLGWKRSNVLFSPCTSSDVAFNRLGWMVKKTVLIMFF